MGGTCFNFFFCISKTFLHVLSGHENALLYSGVTSGTSIHSLRNVNENILNYFLSQDPGTKNIYRPRIIDQFFHWEKFQENIGVSQAIVTLPVPFPALPSDRLRTAWRMRCQKERKRTVSKSASNEPSPRRSRQHSPNTELLWRKKALGSSKRRQLHFRRVYLVLVSEPHN